MKLQIIILFIVCALVCGLPRSRQHEAPEQEADDSLARAQRHVGGGDHHDAVDFGAHTGDHGAFGWYADFPVHSY